MIEHQKERENMEIKKNLHKASPNRSFSNGIHSLLSELMPERKLISFILYVTHITSLRVRHI